MSWSLVVLALAVAAALGVPTLGSSGAPLSLSSSPSVPSTPSSPAPSGGGPLPGPSPQGAQSYPNGSPFLDVPWGSSWRLDDNLLPEQYATPGGNGLVDTYLLQQPVQVQGTRVQLQVDEGPGYSTAIDSVGLGYVSPGSASPSVAEGSLTVYAASSTQAVPSAVDGSGANVTPLLLDPAANASTPAGSYLVESTGGALLGSFGMVAGADQQFVVLRAEQDPAYPPSSASGITVQVQDPSTGGFTSIGFLAPREYFSDFVLPIGTALSSGTQSVVLRLLWQGTHDLSWLALASGIATLPETTTALLSATSSSGANWTQLLSSTDGQSAVLPPDSVVNLTFALGAPPPAGATWTFVTNGAPLPPGGGPSANFTMVPSSPAVGQAVLFSSTSTDGSYPLTSFTWSFGDGSWATGVNASHAYTQAGNYSVTLTVADAGGYYASATHLLAVAPIGGGGGGGGGGCAGAFACYLVNLTLSVGGAPGGLAQLSVVDPPDCGHGIVLRGASLAPDDHGCRCGDGGSDVAVQPSDDGGCCGHQDSSVPSEGGGGHRACPPEIRLNVTRRSTGNFTSGSATLLLPWNSTAAPDLDDQYLRVEVSGTGSSTPVAVTFSTPFATRTLHWTFPPQGQGQPTVRWWHLGQALGLVLAGGYLVTYDASALPGSTGATGVSWNFSGPAPSGGRQHGCLYANLTCELLHAGVQLPSSFPRATLGNASCAALAGTPWGPLVCANATGGGTTHLFAWNGAYTVTITILGPNGKVTVVRAADAQIASANGP